MRTAFAGYALVRDWFPLTPAGLAVTVVCLLALRGFGYGRMDMVVFALSICGLSIVGFSLFSVTLSALLLRPRLRRAIDQNQNQNQNQNKSQSHNKRQGQGQNPATGNGDVLNAEAGYPNSSGFAVPAYRWLPLMSLEWQLLRPDQMHTHNRLDPDSGLLQEEVTPSRRCLTQQVTRRFTLRDVLGLCRVSWRETRPAQWQVLPQTGRLRSLPVLRAMSAEDGIPHASGTPQGDRMDIRRYAAGDSTRDILWRVYARNRHLNVRLPERSVSYTERTLAYLLTGTQDEAAAGVARFALSQGALGSPWLFAADGSTAVAGTVAAALPLIAGSRTEAGEQAAASWLDEFLQQYSQGNAPCIVFAPAVSGPWLARLQHALSRHQGSFTVVLAADGLISRDAAATGFSLSPLAARVRRIALQPPAGNADPQGVDTAQLMSLVAGLSQQNAHIVIVDRLSGQSFDQRLKRV